jgi:SCP-2 sterol transfer family
VSPLALAAWCQVSAPIRYRFAFTGTLTSTWDMVVAGDTAHMAPATDAPSADATFACEIETFALLMCGRIGFDAALGDKRVMPTGDMAVVQAFKKWLWFQRVSSAKSPVSQRLVPDCL